MTKKNFYLHMPTFIYIMYMHVCIFHIYTDLEILYIDFKHAQIYSATVIKNAYQESLSLKNAIFLLFLKWSK